MVIVFFGCGVNWTGFPCIAAAFFFFFFRSCSSSLRFFAKARALRSNGEMSSTFCFFFGSELSSLSLASEAKLLRFYKVINIISDFKSLLLNVGVQVKNRNEPYSGQFLKVSSDRAICYHPKSYRRHHQLDQENL